MTAIQTVAYRLGFEAGRKDGMAEALALVAEAHRKATVLARLEFRAGE